MRILVSQAAVVEVACPCNCGRMFKPTSITEKYATAGCTHRAKLAGQRRNRAAKKAKGKS